MTTLQDSVSSDILLDLPINIIYFDFSKAFDTVHHDLLLNKLKFQYHIEGRMLKFFKNYQKDRTQRVVLDNCVSNEVKMLSEVPQGSILGPCFLFCSLTTYMTILMKIQKFPSSLMIPSCGAISIQLWTVICCRKILTLCLNGP